MSEDPFSYPVEDTVLISKITDDLWMGGCFEDDHVLPVEVKHYVSLFKHNRYIIEHELLSDNTFHFEDEEGSIDTWAAMEIAEHVNQCRKSGLTLVHCQGGFNRSGLIVGLALTSSGWCSNDAINLMRSNRSKFVLLNKDFEKIVRMM